MRTFGESIVFFVLDVKSEKSLDFFPIFDYNKPEKAGNARRKLFVYPSFAYIEIRKTARSNLSKFVYFEAAGNAR